MRIHSLLVSLSFPSYSACYPPHSAVTLSPSSPSPSPRGVTFHILPRVLNSPPFPFVSLLLYYALSIHMSYVEYFLLARLAYRSSASCLPSRHPWPLAFSAQCSLVLASLGFPIPIPLPAYVHILSFCSRLSPPLSFSFLLFISTRLQSIRRSPAWTSDDLPVIFAFLLAESYIFPRYAVHRTRKAESKSDRNSPVIPIIHDHLGRRSSSTK